MVLDRHKTTLQCIERTTRMNGVVKIDGRVVMDLVRLVEKNPGGTCVKVLRYVVGER